MIQFIMTCLYSHIYTHMLSSVLFLINPVKCRKDFIYSLSSIDGVVNFHNICPSGLCNWLSDWNGSFVIVFVMVVWLEAS